MFEIMHQDITRLLTHFIKLCNILKLLCYLHTSDFVKIKLTKNMLDNDTVITKLDPFFIFFWYILCKVKHGINYLADPTNRKNIKLILTIFLDILISKKHLRKKVKRICTFCLLMLKREVN